MFPLYHSDCYGVCGIYCSLSIWIFDVMDKKEFESVVSEMKQYARLVVENVKLQFAEGVSLLLAEVFSSLVAVLFSLAAVFLVILAVVWWLTVYLGFALAAVIVALLLLMLSVAAYLVCRRLFADMFAGSVCRIFFPKDDGQEDGE